jgi:hypothetical protein
MLELAYAKFEEHRADLALADATGLVKHRAQARWSRKVAMQLFRAAGQ